MRVMEKKRTALEKLRWQEQKSNKPFWEEQCRNYISALVLETFPQAKRKNFWGCQCLVENSNSSLGTLKSHHKLSFSLLTLQRLVLHRNWNPDTPKCYKSTATATFHYSGRICQHIWTCQSGPLSPGQNTHSPYAFCRSVGQGCDNVYGPTACSWYTCSLALRAPISFHCTGHSTLSASHNNAHYQFQDQSLLEISSSLAARAHPSHLTDVQ